MEILFSPGDVSCKKALSLDYKLPCFIVIRRISLISAYSLLSACHFPEITMATINFHVHQAMSAISSWAECSNTNNCAINQLATPLNETANAFLDATFLC